MRLSTLVIAAAFSVGSLAARADLMSDTFAGSFDQPQGVPTTPTIYFIGGAGASITWLVDAQITNSQVIVTMLSTGYLTPGFAGIDVTDVSEDLGFTGLTADPASTFIGPTATFTSNSFAINLAEVSYYSGQQAIFDIERATTPSSVTPEPPSFALLGAGLLGVAGVVRKRLA